ncbi:uncharacterized protein LAJ45_06938 [Morchella importuna]|uniref:uncharacterized protein n=1 Tax=Morchella importuna TaxID=1174673 RepID=UPI001E8EBA63|nr:uncharacterized protein LAJ45_06938 [Morchella importuna]KAH8148963.1 hypothetical protein LAJ45_06938 [Morchella importuna]
MTRDHRNIQAMLATQFNDFGLAHERRAHQAILGTRGIFTKDGPEWKESRALLRPSFDRASVADLSALETFVTRTIAKINASPGSDGYHEVDLQALLLELTMDASTDFLFGSPIGAQEGRVSAEGQMSFSESFDVSQDVVSIRFTLNDLYWLVNPKRFRIAITVVHKLVGHYVTRALQKHNSNSSADKPYTKDTSTSGKYIFLEALSQKTQNPQVLQDQILSVMMAGRDTTASTPHGPFTSSPATRKYSRSCVKRY